MIVPLTYFIEKPFQNWTRETTACSAGSSCMSTIRCRSRRLQHLTEIAHESKLWDGKVAVLQVSRRPGSMGGRAARPRQRPHSAGQTWDLRCEVREKLIAFLQAEYPHALPRQRAELAGPLPGQEDAVAIKAVAAAEPAVAH